MRTSVLSLLEAAGPEFLSGEEMSARLGITRAAVWKQVKRLRETGYEIEAVTNLGYRLLSKPDALDGARLGALLEGHPWRDQITLLETVDSTNDLAKREALTGAPHGTVYLAEEQTGGRGRPGRSFSSPRGAGIYLSLLLRPDCAPTQVGHVTAMTAVATLNAIEAVCGVRPSIKWTNDLILGGKKLCGILTEMGAEWESGTLEYLVIGIGINCNHQEFPNDLQDKAISLRQYLDHTVDRTALAAQLIWELSRMNEGLLSEKRQWLSQYARDCITIGRPIRILRGGTVRTGQATGIDENGALLVRYDSGESGVVFSGEVSIRGEHGYL